jgi:single-stranded DNA-specific DHH superfamily exonuclease
VSKINNDLDGVGSPVVLNASTRHTDDEVKAVYYTNNGAVESTIFEDIYEKHGMQDYKLIIADHSPTLAAYERLVKDKVDFLIFDHHKSSQLIGLDDSRVVIDLKSAATSLFFDSISKALVDAHEETKTPMTQEEVDMLANLRMFVFHVNDYDMWIHDHPHSKRLNELLYETNISEFVRRFSKNPDPVFTEVEEILVNSAEKKRNKYIDKAEKTAIIHTDHVKNKFAVVFAESHQSELGHELMTRLDVDFIFIVNAQASKVSLRSQGAVDVSEVANHFATLLDTQSGGHKAAAGFMYEPAQLPKLYHLLETY